ncbi:hypothetical protein NBO_24g0029 [Nosema bombycis CQ1]|uniref:Uncharacterized protein n=1 Tax=Nosema bombycis (strain CQ1 / CVCC 102059) TaxID=578461 RepID=R0M9C8_NOSB1|nr:hypothetical protein NBO_24g0029 [Nosema bombycis CQ1]|eukprot:EOB14584.1 hypothetical protein NBO_24g0029 [Nosema bombycis CQ1]
MSSLKLQSFDSIEDQSLEFSTKRKKMVRNLTPESSNTSNELNLNLNDKKIIKQLISPLKEILFNTLIVFE